MRPESPPRAGAPAPLPWCRWTPGCGRPCRAARGSRARPPAGFSSSACWPFISDPERSRKERRAEIVRVAHKLIYDWNHDVAGPRPVAMLDDETLRDGLQSPSVRTPSIEEKIDILERMDKLGIDTADIGLPGAGPRVARDVERLARAIGERRLKIQANCAARTLASDIIPIAEIQQRTGGPIECCAFIESSRTR